MSEEAKEKDNFWLIVGAVIVVFATVMLTIKSLGSKDYDMAAKAIAEDSANSAYRTSPLNK